MKTNMEDIDKLIKDTLTEEEAKFYDSLDEQSVFAMIAGLYKGKNLWFTIVMHVVNIVAFGLMIYCLIQTFDAENTNDLMLWIAGFFICFITMSMLKIYAWMQIHRNALTREIKRLELQVSSLSSKIAE
ncbi:hypothetical protein H8K90_15425 [Winogradskyella echinorum]|uniref:Holin-X, holin superfamily III n=1 Tax=Winogradskyella echinorum TaxID=538189 RepID=A0ABR6Y6A9_9FLAO|nr:DUF6768 family protein [Winogradskyella echinorum]MBC3847788.1 hypothetical protein [Winogradskyella echinorum]MBC5752136.1 hypothetical protein [Winogradskyella echinorum]